MDLAGYTHLVMLLFLEAKIKNYLENNGAVDKNNMDGTYGGHSAQLPAQGRVC